MANRKPLTSFKAVASRWCGALSIMALFALSGLAMAVGGDDESVNLLPSAQQLAQRETCPDGGVLRFASEPAYAGLPWHLVETVPAIQRQHDALTIQEKPWVKRMEGPSQFNRVYELNGASVLVIDNCKPHSCNEASLYGVVALPSMAYGLELNERGRTRRLGQHNPITDAAIACARAIDLKRRSR